MGAKVSCCAACKVNPDPRGWSACHDCRKLNEFNPEHDSIVLKLNQIAHILECAKAQSGWPPDPSYYWILEAEKVLALLRKQVLK